MYTTTTIVDWGQVEPLWPYFSRWICRKKNLLLQSYSLGILWCSKKCCLLKRFEFRWKRINVIWFSCNVEQTLCHYYTMYHPSSFPLFMGGVPHTKLPSCNIYKFWWWEVNTVWWNAQPNNTIYLCELFSYAACWLWYISEGEGDSKRVHDIQNSYRLHRSVSKK